MAYILIISFSHSSQTFIAAYLMLRIAKPRVGEIVLDCMCGAGTVPLCASASWKSNCFGIGGEIDRESLQQGVQVCRSVILKKRKEKKLCLHFPFFLF